jgi:DNA-binding NtrC family response regulator
LRERREDVPLLAVRFLEELGVDPASCLDAESLSELIEHDWPGNVRELRNTLERAAALMQPVSIDGPGWSRTAAGELRGLDLDIPLPALKQRLSDQLERDYVKALHRACNGNVSEVARRAGLSRMTVYRVLARHGLAESDP